jgi:nucleoside-diphosphate-sugar epimerase
MTTQMTVAVTGADGGIGRVLNRGLSDRFDGRWLSRDDADVSHIDAVERAIRGAEAVVHLAAAAEIQSDWDEVLPANVVGAYNVFEAAHRVGVRRVVFASSNHAVGMYMHDGERFADPANPVEVAADAPVRPDSLYGASKAWGEAIGRFYAEQRGLEVVCLRIGWVTDDDGPPSSTELREEPPDVRPRAPGMWLSHRDLVSLVEASLTADVRFAIVHGVSDNVGRWLSLDDGRRLLGWRPRDGVGREGG